MLQMLPKRVPERFEQRDDSSCAASSPLTLITRPGMRGERRRTARELRGRDQLARLASPGPLERGLDLGGTLGGSRPAVSIEVTTTCMPKDDGGLGGSSPVRR